MNIGDINKIKVETGKYRDFDGRMHVEWRIQIPLPIKYSESESCLTPKEYEDIGRYWSRPVNLLNTRDMTIETLSFRQAELYIHQWLHYKIISSYVYPIYNVDNNMIGYIDHDEVYYTDEYLKANHQYRNLVKKYSSEYVSSILYIVLIIWLLYSAFFK